MTRPPIKISIILPAHDEECGIGRLIEGLIDNYKEKILEIIVIDDGSNDDTAGVVEHVALHYPGIVKLIRKSTPCGVGYAIKLGLEQISKDAEYVLMMDSDFIYNIPEVKYLIKEAENGQKAVIGSRFLKDSQLIGYPRNKLIGNRLYNLAIKFGFGISKNDLTNNFKLYHIEIVKKLPLRSNHFAINAELGILPFLFGYDLMEVPVTWAERLPGMGESKFIIKKICYDYFLSFCWCLRIKMQIKLKHFFNLSSGSSTKSLYYSKVRK